MSVHFFVFLIYFALAELYSLVWQLWGIKQNLTALLLFINFFTLAGSLFKINIKHTEDTWSFEKRMTQIPIYYKTVDAIFAFYTYKLL